MSSQLKIPTWLSSNLQSSIINRQSSILVADLAKRLDCFPKQKTPSISIQLYYHELNESNESQSRRWHYENYRWINEPFLKQEIIQPQKSQDPTKRRNRQPQSMPSACPIDPFVSPCVFCGSPSGCSALHSCHSKHSWSNLPDMFSIPRS